MFRWLRRMEAMAAAAAFAEHGEWQTAREILNQSRKRSESRETDRMRKPRQRAREQSYRA
ncbi:MAG: hypothetical protein AB1646_26135 [Thermodesulfobacteriota bacterium]